MVDGFVPIEQPAHAIVDAAFVGVNRRADLNMAVSEADSIAPGDAGANLCLNASALALTTGDNGSLADASTAKVQPLAFVLRSLFPPM